jgi:hypothetical protein
MSGQSPKSIRQKFIELDADRKSPTYGADVVYPVGGRTFGFASDCLADTGLTAVSGADAQAADAVAVGVTGGAIRLVTGNADGAVANDGSQIFFGAVQLDETSGNTVVEARVRIATAITTVSVFVGLTDSAGLEEPFTNATDTITSVATDGVGFHFDSAATTLEWWMVGVDSNTDDTGNAALGVAPVADVWQVLRLEVNPAGDQCNFYVDGAWVGELVAAGCGPDVMLYPTIIANATTTTSKTVDISMIKFHGEHA